MVRQESINNLQQLGAETVAQAKIFVTEHRQQLQTAGLITAAVVIGAAGGYLLAKGAFVVKATAAAQSGATVIPTLTTQGAAGGVATLQNTATLLTNSLAGGTALVDKVGALINTLSANAVPLTAGVISGGAAGVGATRYQVQQAKGAVAAQAARTATAEAARTHLENALATARTQLDELQIKLAAQPLEPAGPERLEQIKGIGRVFAQKLNAAGIYTLADLATQTPERLREIIGASRTAGMIQPADWIQQAQQRLQAEGPAAATTAIPTEGQS